MVSIHVLLKQGNNPADHSFSLKVAYGDIVAFAAVMRNPIHSKFWLQPQGKGVTRPQFHLLKTLIHSIFGVIYVLISASIPFFTLPANEPAEPPVEPLES